MTKRNNTEFIQDKPTKLSAFLFSAVCFTVAPSIQARLISINIDTGRHVVAIRFGTNNNNKMCFNAHIDSLTGLNIGKLRIQQYIITTCPHIVKHCMDVNAKDGFESIGLNCAVDNVNFYERNSGKLTAMLTYYYWYMPINENPIILFFGLGNKLDVNAIIGKPMLKKLKYCDNISNDLYKL